MYALKVRFRKIDQGNNSGLFRMQGNEPRPTETMLEKMDITDKNGSP